MVLIVSLLVLEVAWWWNRRIDRRDEVANKHKDRFDRKESDKFGPVIFTATAGVGLVAWAICGFVWIANSNYESINQKNVDLAEARNTELAAQVSAAQAESVSAEVDIYREFDPAFRVSYPDVKTPSMVLQAQEKLILLRLARDTAIVKYMYWASGQNALFDMIVPWGVCL